MTEPPLIQIRRLRKTYGTKVAVSCVDLDVHAGEIVGLLGPNGAGKTTTLETVCALRRPTSGSVRVAGMDAEQHAGAVRAHIGTVLQDAALDPVMTGREAVLLQARLRGLGGSAATRAADEALRTLDMLDRADQRIGTLSGGQRRRVDVATAVVGGPGILVLDEPTAGLDPVSRRGLWAHLRQFAADGAALLLSTQDLHEAEALADRLVVLRDGAVVATGPTGDLKASVGESSLVVELAEQHLRDAAVAVATRHGLHAVADGAVVRVRLDAAAGGGGLDYVAALVAAKVPFLRFTVDEPSLDDVYVHLTATGAPTPRDPAVALVSATAGGCPERPTPETIE